MRLRRLLTWWFPGAALVLACLQLRADWEDLPGHLHPLIDVPVAIVLNALPWMTPLALRWRKLFRLPVVLVSLLLAAYYWHALSLRMHLGYLMDDFVEGPWFVIFTSTGVLVYATSCLVLLFTGPPPATETPSRLWVAGGGALAALAVYSWWVAYEGPRQEAAECEQARAAGRTIWKQYVDRLRHEGPKGQCVSIALELQAHPLARPYERRRLCSKPLAGRVVEVRALPTNRTYPEYDFDADNLLDGYLETSWQPRATGVAGEPWVRIAFDAPVDLEEVVIANGFQRFVGQADLFGETSRVKRATIELSNGSTFPAVFDASDRAPLRVAIAKSGVQWLRLIVEETWAAERPWDDVAISEVGLCGPPPPAPPTAPVVPKAPKPVARSNFAHLFEGIWFVDEGKHSFLYVFDADGQCNYSSPGGGTGTCRYDAKRRTITMNLTSRGPLGEGPFPYKVVFTDVVVSADKLEADIEDGNDPREAITLWYGPK